MTDFYVGARVHAKKGYLHDDSGEGVLVQILPSGRNGIVIFPDSPHGPTDGSKYEGQAEGWAFPLAQLELIPNLPATNTGD